MSMRRTAIALTLAAGLAAVAAPARADTFSGFSGVDRPYLVNQDRVCHPIPVASSTAAGAPRCEKAGADVIARLSIKPPILQSGAKASFTAQAAGKTLTISRKTGGTVVTWDAPDPVVKIVELYASQYDDRVAVAYTVRRAGKEVTDVVAFDLGQNQTAVREVTARATPGAPPDDTASTTPPAATEPLPTDPRIVKAVADARAAPRARALAAWSAVLAVDAAHAEALFRTAAAQIAAKQTAQAIATLQALAASQRGDAIEWQIEARFDPAFASVRADPKFRAAVGLDRKPATAYERLLGFGGQWEQTGTSCDKPEVRFIATRDRNFKLRVKTRCEGSIVDTPFRGTWRIEGQRVVLQLPTQGRAASAADEASCTFETEGDEDALRCSLGHDIDFVVLPTRR
ncbi:MAG TPA: tetratricopeptide repeat protein [Kofleriaceae bacterium]